MLAESIRRISWPDADLTELAHDDEALSCLPIRKTADDAAIFGAADFVTNAVGQDSLDAIESVTENVCFCLAMAVHGDGA